MEKSDKDIYFLAVKVFLRDKNKLLVIRDSFGDWDLPGGRIRKDEFNTPFEAIINRKMKEEIGPNVGYDLGEQKTFFRVEREEHELSNMKVRIFALGYEAKYVGGDIELGGYIDEHEWVDVNTFKPEALFTGGWLTGVQKYLEITKK